MLYTLVEELIFVFTNATTDRQPDELNWHRKSTFALYYYRILKQTLGLIAVRGCPLATSLQTENTISLSLSLTGHSP